MELDPNIFKVKTGIDGLDKICNGGVNRSSIISLTGPTGSGKTIFSMQFIVKGALDYDEPGLYLSFGNHKDYLFMQMQSFGWDLEEMERNKQMVFIEYPINEIEQFLSQNSVVTELIDAMGVERVVIDSINPIAKYYQEREQAGLIKFFDNVRKWGCTTLLVCDSSNEKTNFPKTDYDIEKICDAWINIEMPYSEKVGREKYLEVLKLKGSDHEKKKQKILINENGIVFCDFLKRK